MATMTRTVTLNAAFLQEIKEDNLRLREMRNELRKVFCRERLLGMSRFALIGLLEEFRDQLATHFALEEAFGYFDDPVDVAPHLSDEVDMLRRQHGDMFQDVCDLAERAADGLRKRASVSCFQELSERFAGFDQQFCEHESRENELIMEAFNDDIGVGD